MLINGPNLFIARW